MIALNAPTNWSHPMIPDFLFEYIALNPKLFTAQLMSLCAVGVIGVWVAFYKEIKKQGGESNGED